jgi:hypothetical protein
MSSAYYKIYLTGILNLVGTMVVKSEVCALAINNWLGINQVEADSAKPETWKYYMNMAGLYHSTDERMFTKSLDTAELIEFTTANLKEHRNTRREYTYRSRYYNELVERFPEQAGLINGILNPVDIRTAIAAKDHTILYYDQSLVETSEVDLIHNLQLWINGLYNRWDVPDYSYTESLFTAAQLGLLYAMMPKQIINLRLDNCKTDRAHSFHIKQYLTSFGRLDPYVDFLTAKQRLFFYRNIRYLNHNSGKTETFKTLTEKVLTDRFFPLAEYTIRNNSESIVEDLYPSVELRRTSINGLKSALGLDIKTVKEVLDLQQGLARINTEIQGAAEGDIVRMMKNSLSSELETKVLESNVLDKTDAEPFTLSDVIFNHWIYFAATGRYKSIFAVTNPSTGEDMFLSSKDMFVLWIYAYNKARGATLLNVPNIVAKRVKRNPLPTFAELRGITDSVYVDEKFINSALDNQPTIGTIISVDRFKELCQTIHRGILRHRDLSIYQQHFITRGQLEVMTDRFYMDYECNLSNEVSYDIWLSERSISLLNVADKDLDLLATNIYTVVTGQNLVATKSLQEIHTAHIRLMTQLSSYSVQYIQQINTSSLKIEDWCYVRPGDIDSMLYNELRVKVRHAEVLEFDVHGKPGYMNSHPSVSLFKPTLSFKRYEFIELNVRCKQTASGSGHYRQSLPRLAVDFVKQPAVDLTSVPASTVPVGYVPFETIPLSSIFLDAISLNYSGLTQREKDTLILRNL